MTPISIAILSLAIAFTDTVQAKDMRPAVAARQFNIAIEAFQSKDYRQSRKILTALIKGRPHYPLYHFNRGNANYALGDYQKAVKDYENVITLKSPLAPAAELYLAKCYRRMERKSDAIRLLESLFKQKVPEAIAHEAYTDWLSLTNPSLEQALEHYRAGKYSEAINSADGAIKERPSGEAYFVRGLSYIRLNEPVRARYALQKSVKLAPEDPWTEEARHLIHRIEAGERLGWSTLSFFSDLSFGYNTNINLDGNSRAKASRWMIYALLGGGYEFFRRQNWSARATYGLSWEEFFGLPSNRYVVQTLLTRLRYEAESWSVHVYPRIGHEMFDSTSLLLKAGFGAAARKALTPYELAAVLTWDKNFSQKDLYRYLAGSSSRLRLIGGYSTEQWLINGGYYLVGEDCGDLDLSTGTVPLGYFGHGPSVQATWLPNRLWIIEFSVLYLFKSYRNLATPGNVERHDRLLRAYAKASRSLSPAWRLWASIDTGVNSSSLGETSQIDDKNYTQVIGLAGISWDIQN